MSPDQDLPQPGDPELPQDVGPRTGEMRRALPRVSVAHYHDRLMAVLREMPAEKIDGQERLDRLAAAEVRRQLYAGDESVTEDDCMREEVRVDAKWRLRRPTPLDEFPQGADVLAYTYLRKAKATGKPPERSGDERIGAGRSGYWTWYRAKYDDVVECARLFAALKRFGDATDRQRMHELLTRVGNVCAFVEVRYDDEQIRPPGARRIPWLPVFKLSPLRIDEWWWGHWTVREHTILAWWQRAEPKARALLPSRGQVGLGL